MPCYYTVLYVFFLCSMVKTIFSNDGIAKNNYELLEDERPLDNLQIGAHHIALLIEDSSQNFRKVLHFVQNVSNEHNFKERDWWLITFNSSGVSSVWEKSSNNVEKFHETLHYLASQSSNMESGLSTNSLPIFALLHTAQILPKNGTVILFTDSPLNMDTHLENIALNTILSKNISVYTVKDNNNQDKKDLLQNIREYSGGKILKLNLMPKREDYKQITYTVTGNVAVILSRKNLLNWNELSFPIDHDVTGIHVTITPCATTTGMLISPTGYRFSFSNKSKSNPIRYSQGSVFENQNGFFDVHLNFSTSGRPTIGIWQLKLENLKEVYNVTVFAFTNTVGNARIYFDDQGLNKDKIPKDMLKLGVTGNISHITDINVLDSNGETLLGNVTYMFNNPVKYVTQNVDNVPDIRKKEVHVEINKQQSIKSFYALIKGEDVKGNAFQRLTYIFGKSDLYLQQSITVDVGLGSELIIASGRKAEVYFEVTNQGSDAQHASFSCSDSKYILQSLSLYRRYLEPQESTIVTLYLNTKYGMYQDEITFSVTSSLQHIQKKVVVDVGSQIADKNQPELNYKYTTDCTGILFAQCSKSTWTIEITARDTESGLLQLNTIPRGIFFPYGYTSGTRDSVTGYYSGSCCNPDLQISAVDRMNNRNSYAVNAFYAKWSPGAIAAIVLGILLFIILVAVAIFFIVKKWKPKESYDLPTYRGGGI